MSCIICFTSLSKPYYCSNTRCNDQWCKDCLLLLIDFCCEEKTLPKCPSRYCGCVLILNDLKNLDKNVIDQYNQLCMTYFIKDHGTILEKELSDQAILTRLQQERRKFLTETYPKAICLVAHITFNKKLNQMDKIRKELDHTVVKRCFNTTCSGYLSNYQCTSCQSQFCNKCETIIKPNHICKQNDLDCVHLINSMVKCPGCHLPVFKNEGCNHITCSVCNTNFDYITGQKGESGSHNHKIIIKNDIQYKLSDLYKDKLSSIIFDKLLLVEAHKPKIMNKEILLVSVKKYMETKDNKWCSQLTFKMNKYYINSYLIRDYEYGLIQLEELIKNNGQEKEMIKILDQLLTPHL